MSQDYFVSNIGGFVTRINPDGRTQRISVANYKIAQYLYDLQSHGYKYLNIQNVDNGCAACEA